MAQAPQTTPPTGTTVATAAHAVNAVKVHGKGDAAVRALDGFSIDFEQGRFTAIMGPSGSGKSTLLHCVAGLDRLTAGETYIGDVELGGLKDKQLTLLRRESIGFLFQSFNLVPTLSAADNISLPQRIAGHKPDAALFSEIVKITGLGDRLSHRPSELSGGQRQRVAAARALVSRPAIIFADEPTGNLDSRAGAELLGFLREAVDQQQQTIVMVTHDPAAAARADRVVFLADGRVVEELRDPTADGILGVMRHLGQ
ncbi:MAG: ABC transporter ATP-binding protein [Candidatus Dormibacteria bacterium]